MANATIVLWWPAGHLAEPEQANIIFGCQPDARHLIIEGLREDQLCFAKRSLCCCTIRNMELVAHNFKITHLLGDLGEGALPR